MASLQITETFTSSQNWTVPVDLTGTVLVESIGAGGGGAEATNSPDVGGGAGGGGGSTIESVSVTEVAGTLIPIGIGSGGTGGGSNGNAGGNTTFGESGKSYRSVANGGGGGVRSNSTRGAAGAAGTGGYIGGTGGRGNSGPEQAGGGGGAGLSGAGANGQDGKASGGTGGAGGSDNPSSGTGGNGDHGSLCNSVTGGTIYGGGGGGACSNGTGGSGAQGWLRITYTISNVLPDSWLRPLYLPPDPQVSLGTSSQLFRFYIADLDDVNAAAAGTDAFKYWFVPFTEPLRFPPRLETSNQQFSIVTYKPVVRRAKSIAGSHDGTPLLHGLHDKTSQIAIKVNS